MRHPPGKTTPSCASVMYTMDRKRAKTAAVRLVPGSRATCSAMPPLCSRGQGARGEAGFRGWDEREEGTQHRLGCWVLAQAPPTVLG